jgi:hypothetical protein
MKKKFLYIIIPIVVLILSSSSGPTKPPWAKENVSFPMMNQEIRHTMQENDRQKEMKKKQDVNLALETTNKKEWTNFKETTRKIQDRLRIVDFALQAIPTGYAMVLESQRIADLQQQIWQEIQTAPYSIAYALPQELTFVNDLQMVVRLLIGIAASYGAINQMEKAERKILLDYALEEVRQLTRDAFFMLGMIRDIKQKIEWNKFMLKNYVNMDKQIIKEIMSNHF